MTCLTLFLIYVLISAPRIQPRFKITINFAWKNNELVNNNNRGFIKNIPFARQMWFVITGSNCTLEQEIQTMSEMSLPHVLAMVSTAESWCPTHIPSPFLCMAATTSKCFAWVGWVWVWAGQKFKELHPLRSTLSIWLMGLGG